MASTAQTLKNFIDGEPVAGGGETEAVLNPATGEELTRAPVSSAEEVDRAVRAARAAFEPWSNTTPATRAAALLAIADLVEEHGEEIARLEALNAGKPIEAVSNDEIPVMADNLRFFAGAARCLEGRAAGDIRLDGVDVGRLIVALRPAAHAAPGGRTGTAAPAPAPSYTASGSPSASATAGWVTCPWATLTPGPSPGSRAIAPATPRSARAST